MAAIRKLSANFIATQVDGEVLIVDLDGGELFSLAGTAKAVWEAIDGHRDLGALTAEMCEAHMGDATKIAADIAALVEDLEHAALVERVRL